MRGITARPSCARADGGAEVQEMHNQRSGQRSQAESDTSSVRCKEWEIAVPERRYRSSRRYRRSARHDLTRHDAMSGSGFGGVYVRVISRRVHTLLHRRVASTVAATGFKQSEWFAKRFCSDSMLLPEGSLYIVLVRIPCTYIKLYGTTLGKLGPILRCPLRR